MNRVSTHIDRDTLRRLALRSCFVAVVICGVMVMGASRLLAGCHYGDGRGHHGHVSDNPREHARNFSFLGQWVYERGDIKYVPVQSNSPCQGPHCRADKPVPVSAVTPVSSAQRLPNVILLLSSKSNPFSVDGHNSWLCQDNWIPLTGFASELERPPRLAGSF